MSPRQSVLPDISSPLVCQITVTAVSIAVFALVWQTIAAAFAPRQFPGIIALMENVWVVISGGDRFAPVVTYGTTITRVVTGFMISMVLATFWGVIMGVQQSMTDYLAGPLFVLLTVPSVVWAFVGVLWLGLTEFAVPVLVIVLIVFPYLTTIIWEGTRDLNEDLLKMATTYDARRSHIWRDIYLPHIKPVLFGAMRVGLAVSWKLALVAEVFGTATGVGVAVNYHFEAFDTGMVIAWAIPVMGVMIIADRLLRWSERQAAQKRGYDTETTNLIA